MTGKSISVLTAGDRIAHCQHLSANIMRDNSLGIFKGEEIFMTVFVDPDRLFHTFPNGERVEIKGVALCKKCVDDNPRAKTLMPKTIVGYHVWAELGEREKQVD